MTRSIKWLLLAFVVLAVLTFVFWKMNQPAKQTQDIPLFVLKAEDVASFELNHFTLGLLFQREGEKWMIKNKKNALTNELETKTGAPIVGNDSDFVEAKADEVNGLLNDLFALKNLEVVATQKAENNVFEINNYSLHLIFYGVGGTELDRISFGKHGPQIGTAFIKKGAADTVYLSNRDFSVSLLRQYDAWLLNPPKEKETKPHGKRKK